MGKATRFAWSEPDWIGVTLGSFACMERLDFLQTTFVATC